ncbi:hypothetical protein S40293_08187 [Stachybotrys chartarum IBT 40293]|nr:hypothetical protein S40293_08187 [Stachybotrys chartarum IBT 40293]
MSPQSDPAIHADPNDSWHGVITKKGQFPPEKDRYHLYIGLFCPFAHRANLVRHLKGLESIIDISIVKAYPKGDENGWPGWRFNGENKSDDVYPGATEDKLFGSKFLHEVYFKADSDYKGRYSVPVLWDKKQNTIVSNESAELLRWLPTAFDDDLQCEEGADRALDLYPDPLKEKIDEISTWMQRDLNSGVYKAGFAKDQNTYNDNVPVVFAALNQLESIIHGSGGPYILGQRLTELDIRAYATVIRFDTIYVQHFKCNLGTIRGNYPVIHEWLKNLYWNVKGFKETTDFVHIKENYSKSHGDINPLAITPLGPFPDIEDGVNLNFIAMEPGVVKHPHVLKKQKELYGTA